MIPWTLLSSPYRNSHVTGVFIESAHKKDKLSSPAFANIGITQLAESTSILAAQNPPDLPMPTVGMPPSLAAKMYYAYFALGHFSNVSRLHVFTSHFGVSGIAITHDDTSVEIMGQWPSFDQPNVSEIYNRGCGTLTSIVLRRKKCICGCNNMRLGGILVGTNGRPAVNLRAPLDATKALARLRLTESIKETADGPSHIILDFKTMHVVSEIPIYSNFREEKLRCSSLSSNGSTTMELLPSDHGQDIIGPFQSRQRVSIFMSYID